MNYLQAKRIRKGWVCPSSTNEMIDGMAEYFQAGGYLEAHAKAEKLVAKVQIVCDERDRRYGADSDVHFEIVELKEALEQWRQSNGVGKP